MLAGVGSAELRRGVLPRRDFVEAGPPALDVLVVAPRQPRRLGEAETAADAEVGEGEMLAGHERVALEALYLRVLARSPSSSEVQSCGKYIMAVGNRREAFEDILWALVNSTEFLSRK